MTSEKLHRSLRLLRWFCPPHLLEEIEGDLMQRYERDLKAASAQVSDTLEVSDTNQRAVRRANRRLLWNTLRYFRPGIILRNKFNYSSYHLMMFSNYFKMGIRSLLARRTNAVINAIGLSIGIACTILILNIVRFETSFDQFHSDAERNYRIVRISQIEGQEEYRTGVVYPLPPALRNEVPAIEHIASVLYWSWGGMQVEIPDAAGENRKFQEAKGFAMVEPTFFRVFDFSNSSFRWLAGSPEKSLTEPLNVVLTRSMAIKYFGTTDVLGKTLKLDQDWDCTVTGVVEDLPANTDFPFTIMLSYSTLYGSIGDRMTNWWSVGSNESYVKLAPGATRGEVEAQIETVHASHTPRELHSFRKYKLQPLAEVHTDSRFGNFNQRIVSSGKVQTLAIIGIFLLITACINYINLATAHSSLRSKEIGIRKVLGGLRQHLVLQFIVETFLITLVAATAGLLMAEWANNQFQRLVSVPTSELLLLDPFILQSVVFIVLLVSLAAGFYPAIVISGFNPLLAIKNKLSAVTGSIQLRQVLVVLQFSVTLVFVIAAFVVTHQMLFFRNIDLGFAREAIVNVELQNSDRQRLQLLSNALNADSHFADASFSSSIPAGYKRPTSFVDMRKKESNEKDNLVVEYQRVDVQYIPLYEMALAAGRNFIPTDSLAGTIINQTLAAKLGFTSDEEAIGQEVVLAGRNFNIVGVIEDYHSKSLKEEVDKIALVLSSDRLHMASIKLNRAQPLNESLGALEQIWSNLYPESAISYRFLDENIATYYREEAKFSKLLQVFSIILVGVGCLGLYGLITFVVERKMKALAIRKVFGAGIVDLFINTSRDYLGLLLISLLIAVPIAYEFLRQWLDGFAYHVSLQWWMLLLPCGIVFAITLLAVSRQILKGARVNPVETLKYE
ncbi:MAG: ABC transporter permease [Cyclobacteriaceae bacterium]